MAADRLPGATYPGPGRLARVRVQLAAPLCLAAARGFLLAGLGAPSLRALRDSLAIRKALAGVLRDCVDGGGSPAEGLARLPIAVEVLSEEEDVRWALISALMD